MKKNLILSLLIGVNNLCIAQTTAGPIIGIDFAQTENAYIDGYRNLDQGFETQNIVFGGKIEQVICDKLFVSYQFSYNKKKIPIIEDGWMFIVPVDGFEFKYYRNSLSAKYKIFELFYLGIGGDYNILNDFKYTFEKKIYDNAGGFVAENPEEEFGIHLSGGVKYKKFDLELYYYKGLASNKGNKHVIIGPIQSIGVTLSYDFKLFNKLRGGKKVDCPKI